MPRYTLGSGFYDGSVVHKRGDTVELPDTVKPPRGAKLIEEPKAQTPAKAPAKK